MTGIPLTLEESFAQDQVNALVVALREDERPLRGLAARLNWRFRGEITRAIETGRLTGRMGELTLVPIQKHDRIVPILLVGVGSASPQRREIPQESAERLLKNLNQLGPFRWGLSQEDLGASATWIAKQFRPRAGGELCLTR